MITVGSACKRHRIPGAPASPPVEEARGAGEGGGGEGPGAIGDEESGDATVLIRMQPGRGYPAHRHVGLEEVFILQGGYRDNGGERRAGEYILNEAGSAHAPIAFDGEDCIMLAVAHGGIELLKSRRQ